jgi:hypothetical protein
MIDPEEKNVTIWWQGHGPIVLEGDEVIADIPALPVFRCSVAELFATPGDMNAAR